MAVKTKINLRVLVAVVTVMLFLVGGFAAHRIRGKIKPTNIQELSEKMDQAVAEKDYPAAVQIAQDLIKATDDLADPSYRIRVADVFLTWMRSDPSLNASQRRDCLLAAVKQLRTAVQIDPNCLEAYRKLCDLQWPDAVRGAGLNQFIESADAVLRLKKDAEILYRRGYARMRMAEVDERLIDSGMEDLKAATIAGSDVARYWLGGPDPITRAILPGYLNFVNKYMTVDVAKATFEQAIAALPGNGDVRVAYGMFLMSNGMRDDALVQFQDVARLEPNNPVGDLEMAEYYLRQRQYPLAMSSAQAAITRNQEDYRCYVKLAQVQDMMGQSNEAVGTIRAGIDRILKTPATTATADGSIRSIWMDKKLAAMGLYFSLGNLLLDGNLRKNDPAVIADAKQCLSHLSEISADSYETNQLSGRLAMIGGDFVEAMSRLQKAFDARPSDAQSAMLLFDSYIQAGLPGKAEAVLAKMEKMQTYHGSPLLSRFKIVLAIIYRDYSRAAGFISQLSSMSQEDEWVRQMSWVLSVASGRTTAFPSDIVPTAASIYILRDCASQLWAREDRRRAVAILEGLHSRVPDNVDVIIQLSRAYGGMGEPDKAKSLLEKARAADPTSNRIAGEWQLVAESDPEKQFAARLALTDKISDPLLRAIARADLCLFHGKNDLCLKYLQEARSIDSSNTLVMEKLFDFAIRIKDLALARQCVETASQGNLDRVGGWFYKGKLAMAEGQFDKAIAAFNQALSRRSDMKEAKSLLGDCYLAQYQKDRQSQLLVSAYDTYKSVLEMDPTYPPALVGISIVTELQGKFQEHAERIQTAWDNCPENPYVRDEYMAIQRSRLDPSELIRICESVFARDPNNLKNIHTLARLYEDRRIQRNADAERMYRLFYEKSPNKLPAAGELIGFLVRAKKPGDIEEIFKQLRQTEKDQVGVLTLYGQYLAPSNNQLAEDAFRRAIAADPKNIAGYSWLATFYIERREWKKAAGVMEDLLKVYPDNMSARKDLIRIYISDEQFDAAKKMVDSLLSSNPDDVEAIFCDALISMSRFDFVEAQRLFKRTLDISPRYITSMQNLSRIARIQGCEDMAIYWLQEGVKASNNNPLIACELGSAYAMFGQFDMAERVFKEVLISKKDFLPAIRLLSELYVKLGKWEPLEPLLTEAIGMFQQETAFVVMESRMLYYKKQNGKRVSVLEDAIKQFPESEDLRWEYISALFDDGQYDKLISYASSFGGNKAWSAIMESARAAATIRKASGKAKQADAMFASAISTAPDVRILRKVFEWMYRVYSPGQIIYLEQQWMKARPDDPQLLLFLGEACGKAGDYKRAIDYLTQVEKLVVDPSMKARVKMAMAGVYQRSGDYKLCEEIGTLQLSSAPLHPGLLNDVAYLYVDSLGQAQKALPLINKAYRLSPDNADIIDTYAWTLTKLRRFEAADRFFAILMQLNNPSAVYYYHAGYFKEVQGQIEQALRYYNAGLEKASGDSSSVELRRTLEDAINRLKR